VDREGAHASSGAHFVIGLRQNPDRVALDAFFPDSRRRLMDVPEMMAHKPATQVMQSHRVFAAAIIIGPACRAVGYGLWWNGARIDEWKCGYDDMQTEQHEGVWT
jgi:hypothetical protein